MTDLTQLEDRVPENPPAFPTPPASFGPSGDMGFAEEGMTLRDWFASRAPEPPATWWGGGAMDCAGYALWGFQYADAMLLERQK